MGVHNLAKLSRPYGQSVILRGKSVVIDGPALAYYILDICRERTGSGGDSLIDEPSYRRLGQTALAWLDHIEACGVTVYLRPIPAVSKVKPLR